ncbi:3D domain-containing protein [Galbibacter mesophilus]|uniref:3D domain-containing protein n=1 Tax=Galbibacter mesophilus TaxID=379069 RepID=UPI00191CF9AD|nr:3D domain-containing protein [Galbibacter mesophilus]MCM5662486.1 3D domain-containing protein [Galbibacter mesophilus]
MNRILLFFSFVFISGIVRSQESTFSEDSLKWVPLYVKASAYNSLAGQTVGNPALSAWGDTLQPGMKAIAISRDLLKLGITHNTPVRIEGLDGFYLVKDKMNARYRKKIDVYMGEELQKARNFGNKYLKIWYGVPIDKN